MLIFVIPTSPHHRRQWNRQIASFGFSLVELVVAMAVFAILAAIAAPSFSNLIASQRAKSAASSIYASLMKTRSDAITLNTSVTLAPKSGDWKNGWQIQDPVNSGGVLDDSESVAGITINGPSNVVYRPSGRLSGSSGTSFIVAATSGATTSYECVSLDPSGRPYMKAASSC